MVETQHVVNVLNHLLAIHNRSLAMYFSSARPWARRQDEPVVRAFLEIAVANQRLVDRIGAMVIELDGVVRYGEFPLRYADWHDLSVEFYLARAIESQEREIVRIGKCVEWLADAPRARALAEESLGEAKAHLETLRELAGEATAVELLAATTVMFDTHAHLDDEQLNRDISGVIARAKAAGVTNILAVGTTLASSRNCIAIASRHEGVFASVGIHPNHSAEAQPGDWDEIVKLASQSRVVALGETGLDRHWDFAPFDVQQDYFDRHLCLSQQLDRAFIVHQRDCEEDVLFMLRAARQRGPLRGVMHSFAGSEAAAAECLELGLYISFAGMVTFKKSDELRAIAATIPHDRILIETDAPYLSPHPHRGQRPNEPALVVHTATCLAEVRKSSLVEFAAQTHANARSLFQV